MNFFDHAGGDIFDFGEFFFVFDAFFEFAAEADGFADFDPVVGGEAGHVGNAGFAVCLEEIVPDGRNGEIVVVPEFAFVAGAVGGFGGVAGVDGTSFAVFVEEVGEADFEKDVVFGEVVFEILFVFDGGVFEGDTVRADEVGVDDVMILGVGIAYGHAIIPDFFFFDGRLRCSADDDTGDNQNKNNDNSSADKAIFDDFIHDFPSFFVFSDILHL